MSDETKSCNCENCNCDEENKSNCLCISNELTVTEEEYKAEDITTQKFYDELEEFLKSHGIIQYAFMGMGEIQVQSIREKYEQPENHPIKVLNKFDCSPAFLIERVFEMISQNPEALYHFSSLLFSKMHEETDEVEDIPTDNG